MASLFKAVAAFVLWASWLRFTVEDCADVLGIQSRRLRRWLAQRRKERRPPPRGRPVEELSYDTRCALIALLVMLGPDVSQRIFLACLPNDIPVREAIRLHDRFLRAYDWKNGKGYCHYLHWERVGAVWTMDHSKPEAPLEKPYRCLFAVRDLGSNRILAGEPTRGETAEEVIGVLKRLFAAYGPPLVIKSDNGPAFISQEVAAFLAAHRVVHLFSPPQMPNYNGAVEAGFGGLKTRTHRHAWLHGHPEYWTCDDVEAGRLAGNELSRCPFTDNLSPDDAWAKRRPITDAERDAFAAALVERLAAVLGDRNLPELPAEFYNRKALERQAIVTTLTQCDYLSIRRRRFTGTINRRKADRIT
jgi:transposase InsO family protein